MRIARILYAVLLLAAAPAGAVQVSIPSPDGVALRAVLELPPGPATGFGIVMLHSCGGAFGRTDMQWMDLMRRDGHPVLAVDSFGSRGLVAQCQVPRDQRRAAPGTVRRGDALASAAWLAARPETPPGGVVLMGWSDGGSAVLAAASPAPDIRPGLLRGFVAFYPVCELAAQNPGWHPAAPMLILSGEADRRAPTGPCRGLAARAPGIKLVSFPGVGHYFDAPRGPGWLRSHAGRTTDADAAAREAVLVQVPAWLAALPALR